MRESGGGRNIAGDQGPPERGMARAFQSRLSFPPGARRASMAVLSRPDKLCGVGESDRGRLFGAPLWRIKRTQEDPRGPKRMLEGRGGVERSGGLGGCVASSTRSTPIHPSIQAIQSIPCLMPMPMPSSVERCKDERGGRGERPMGVAGERAGWRAGWRRRRRPREHSQAAQVRWWWLKHARGVCAACAASKVAVDRRCAALSVHWTACQKDPHVSGLGRLVQIADLGRSNRGHHPPCRCLPRHLPNCAASKIHAPSRPLPRDLGRPPARVGGGAAAAAAAVD